MMAGGWGCFVVILHKFNYLPILSVGVTTTNMLRKISFLECHWIHHDHEPVWLLRTSVHKVCDDPTVIIVMIRSCNFEDMITEEDCMLTIRDPLTHWMPISLWYENMSVSTWPTKIPAQWQL